MIIKYIINFFLNFHNFISIIFLKLLYVPLILITFINSFLLLESIFNKLVVIKVATKEYTDLGNPKIKHLRKNLFEK